MPLVHSKSEPAFRRNVKTLMGEVGKSPHVKSRDQALAIAYSIKRRGKKRGGRAFDYGGFVNAAAAPVSGPPMPSAMAPPATPPSPPVSFSPPPAQMAPQAPQQAPAFAMPDMGHMAGWGGFGAPRDSPMSGGNDWFSQATGGAGAANQTAGLGGFNFPTTGSSGMDAPSSGGFGTSNQMPGLAFGGVPSAPWTERAAARQMMHTGPIPSIVPGRTDRHGIKVPSGSYVLPADHVSSLGQGNTHAGYAVLNKMFSAGPLGGGKIARGPGAPRPPKMMGIPSDVGGARGDEPGKPTDVIVAGGEFVLSPDQVMEVGQGSLKNGHAILDAWVKANRQKHIKVLKGLPPPAKS